MKFPLVSIIIPTYNSEQYISETLHSVQQQTYTNWEVIIVDDQSVDKTKEIVSAFIKANNKIHFFTRSTVAKGGSVCRNIGISTSTGEFIIFLDSDDVLAPWCLTQRVDAMNSFSEIDFGVFNADTFFKKPGDGKLHTTYLAAKNHLYHFMAGHSIWQTTCPIWKADFVKKINGFNELYQRFQDTEFHFRALNTPHVKYKAFCNLRSDCFYRLTYPKRAVGFWNIVVDNNIIYLNEVLNVSMKSINPKLYKSSLSILNSFAITYCIKASGEQSKNYLNVITKQLTGFLSAKKLYFSKLVLILKKAGLLNNNIIKFITLKLLFYSAVKQINKLS